MKRSLLGLMFCLTPLALFAQQAENQEVSSQVSAVTVYFDGAQETRTAVVDLKIGRTQLVFNALTPYMDAKSIQVKANGALTVLSVNHQQNYLAASQPSAERQQLVQQVKTVQASIKTEEAYLAVLQEDIVFLKTNRDLGGRDQTLTVTALKESADFFSQRMTALLIKELERKKTVETLQQQINALNQQLSDLNDEQTYPTGEVLVLVETKQPIKTTFELTYLVSNAGWYPSYDIRANTINEPLEVVYKANIRQQTRNDWKNVKLTLSSYNPGVSGVVPELKPYNLDYNNAPPVYGKDINTIGGRVTDPKKKPLAGVTVKVENSNLTTSTNAQGYYSLTLPANATEVTFSQVGFAPATQFINGSVINVTLNRSDDLRTGLAIASTDFADLRVGSVDEALQGCVAGLDSRASGAKKRTTLAIPQQTVEKQVSVDFEIKTPYTIATDNKVVSVEMAILKLPATFHYYSVPKIKQEVYLVAQLTDWEQHSFLEGEANVFFEGSYVGKTILNVNTAADTLSVSLGRDKSIVVKRERVKAYTSKQFIGSKKEETRSWKTTVRNNRKETINITLLDQTPVSQNQEIEVSRQATGDAIVNVQNGEVKWSTRVEPAQTKEFQLNYTVKYPKNNYLVVE